MSECKATVVVEICAETAVDAVSKRVAGGMKISAACKEVAEEFNKENDATIKWDSLRKSYTRAQKTGTCPKTKKAKLGHVPKLDVPMASVTTIEDNTTIEEANIVIDMFLAEQKKVEELTKIIVDYADVEADVAEEVKQAKEGTIKREVAVDFILKEGNHIQCTMMKTQNPDNGRLFKLFVAVRNGYLKSNPPQSLLEAIRNATRIEL